MLKGVGLDNALTSGRGVSMVGWSGKLCLLYGLPCWEDTRLLSFEFYPLSLILHRFGFFWIIKRNF